MNNPYSSPIMMNHKELYQFIKDNGGKYKLYNDMLDICTGITHKELKRILSSNGSLFRYRISQPMHNAPYYIYYVKD
jgi:hypothetical protein